MKNKNKFRNTLTDWYLTNHRRLPWRETKDPYKIWVSEIILQQTRVNQGLDYYNRFIKRFPDLQNLAEATEEEVLKLWEGLGYYSRARHMHHTARILVNQYDGLFPKSFSELLKLKGIGKYTAAAIASIAFGVPVAVVDGNVLRFLSRYLGIEEPVDNSRTIREIAKFANEAISREEPGIFNQAMMEFGALHCVPSNPACAQCCFSKTCQALKLKKVHTLPFKSIVIKPVDRFFNYLVIQRSGSFLIRRRNEKDIWKHLYDFPMIESNQLLNVGQLLENEGFLTFVNRQPVKAVPLPGNYRHKLTHRVIHARFFKVEIGLDNHLSLPEGHFFTDSLRPYPFPRLIVKFLQEFTPDIVNLSSK